MQILPRPKQQQQEDSSSSVSNNINNNTTPAAEPITATNTTEQLPIQHPIYSGGELHVHSNSSLQQLEDNLAIRMERVLTSQVDQLCILHHLNLYYL